MRPIKLFPLFLAAFILFSPVLWAEKVRYVIDGDTFILESNQRVRMIGIDAPEIRHAKYGKKAEPYGKEAKQYLRRLIQGCDVRLTDGGEPFDRFGRRLAYVYLKDGTFVNRKMVEAGYAETFRQFPFAFKEEFLGLEQKARSEKLGMWAAKKSWAERFRGFWRAGAPS